MISWFEKNSWISWFCVFVIASGIFYVSSLQFAPSSGGFGLNAIIYHLVAFFFLAFFLMMALTKGKNFELVYLAIILALFYAVSDEFHQLFVPGRSGGIFDVIINSLGILFASMIYGIRVLGKN